MKMKRRLWIWIAILGLFIFGSAGIQVLAQAGDLGGGNQLDFLQNSRVQVTDPEAAHLLDEKINALQAQLATQAAIPLLDKPADACSARPAYQVEPTRQAGIIEDHAVPFPPSELMPVNQWQAEISGWWVHVYAGYVSGGMSSETDSQDLNTAGVLLVQIEGQPGVRRYEAAGAEGALAIRSADGWILTVVDEAGQLYWFDAAAEAWLESPSQILPARIPLPTPAPTPDPCG